MLPVPQFSQIPNVKVMLNVGCLLDIPTGDYETGRHGESILNGGIGLITGFAGRGNLFKSTIMHYVMLSAADTINHAARTAMLTYDTEINIHESRLVELAKRFESFDPVTLFNDKQWVITDKTLCYGDKWFEDLRVYLKSKKAQGIKIFFNTPFLGRDKKSLIQMALPTFSEIDSFSEFETSDVAKMQEENALGESGGNTIHMRQGLSKTRLLMELPTLSGVNTHFFLTTVQVGDPILMQSGPMNLPPPKKLQHMRNSDKFKGVPDKFFFLTTNFWQMISASPLINQATKSVEYPEDPQDNQQGDVDLNLVTMKLLRNKSGASGTTIEVIVSQREGVLPTLTEFHYLKNQDRYGISGTLQHYALDLMPEIKLSRTTVRSKIDESYALRRAMTITAEMCQMKQLWRHMPEDLLCTPAQLYKDIQDLGYDWKVLLETRGWWTLNNDTTGRKFLSTMDLLNMRKGLYKPFWL